MKKQLALVAAALCLVACDGPAGPPGPAGKDGKAGADGKAPTADEVARGEPGHVELRRVRRVYYDYMTTIRASTRANRVDRFFASP